jgi:hypothetical protein
MISPLAEIRDRLRARISRRSWPVVDAQSVLEIEPRPSTPYFRGGSKPYTRWWWLAGPFRHVDIRFQLEWLKANGFGGVELAWLWPYWMEDAEPGVEWLSPEWTSLIEFTKQEADRLALGCDFTFGSCWPFGGAAVLRGDAARTFDGFSRQRLHGSWEDKSAVELRVLNHLDRDAFGRYAEKLMPAFAYGLSGTPSALFCDSLEIDTRRLWDPKLWNRFAAHFGYRLEDLQDRINDDPDLRYDYRTMIADAILHEFYEPFAAICHRNGAISRVQCHGAPTDLLAAYAAVDIPESEAILFPPAFARVAASAAALTGKTVVSAETFTCLYGFVTRTNREPYRYWDKEQVADLKLLADALFANGVNHIVWHGMPFNGPDGQNEFYASVHVAPDCAFAADLPAFNRYLSLVSSVMKLGRAESRLAVYLPNEDNRRLDRIPDDERTPAANYRWEMRHVVFPREIEGYAPLWISAAFLKTADIVDGCLRVGDCAFPALLIDVEWLDRDALADISRLVEAGLRLILPRLPKAPGKRPRSDYQAMLDRLRARANVVVRIDGLSIVPIVSGKDVPPFWARRTAEAVYLFFGHPMVRDVRYPLRYGQSFCRDRVARRVGLEFDGRTSTLDLVFEPYQSILTRVSTAGDVKFLDLGYRPPEPVVSV